MPTVFAFEGMRLNVVKPGQFHATIEKLWPQQDEYETDKGKVMVDADFWKGNDKAVDVRAFKRFVATLKVTDAQGSDTCTLVISARGNIVTITRPKKLNVRVRDLVNALKNLSEKFDYHKAGEPYYPKADRGQPQGLVPLEQFGDPDKELAIVGDAYWFADVLHHVREAGGFNGEGKLGPP